MNKVKEWLIAIPYILIPLTIVFLEIAGIAHSFKKHDSSDNMWSIFCPPYAWYRGAEMFWHNDFAGVNWEKRTKDDNEILLAYLSHTESEESYGYKREVELFSKEISKYPPEKLEALKKTAGLFLKYRLAVQQDVINWAYNADSTMPLPIFKLSEPTELTGKEVAKKFSLKESDLNVAMEDAVNNTPDALYKTKYKMGEYAQNMRTDFNARYKNVFNEEYKP